MSLLRQARGACVGVARRARGRFFGHKITDPYAGGQFEHADGSPIDITSKLTKGGVGGGSKKYAANFDKVFRSEPRDRNTAGGASSSLSTSAHSDMSEQELKAAFELDGPEENRKHYDEWAESYDEQLLEMRYVLPQIVANLFFEKFCQLPDHRGPILDVGAGTGLCGEQLRNRLNNHGDPFLSFQAVHIDGTDISSAMLAVAANKVTLPGPKSLRVRPVYSRVFEGNLLSRLPCADSSYEGVVSSGTFTVGHVGPEGLDEVLRVTQPGGLVVMSVNRRHWDLADFQSAFDALEDQITDFEIVDVPICSSDEEAMIAAVQLDPDSEPAHFKDEELEEIMETGRVVVFRKAEAQDE